MKKHLFIILTILLPLTAALGQGLTPQLDGSVYRLLPDSTIIPMTNGVASGPAQPLAGSFVWGTGAPVTLEGSDKFFVTSLNFSNASYHLTVSGGPQQASSISISTNGTNSFLASVNWSESTSNPWDLFSFGESNSYYGSAFAPTRLTFNSVGLSYQGSLYSAIIYLDAELAAGPVNPYPNFLTVSATAQSQQTTNAQSNGSTILNPLKSRIDTRQLLVWLAQDEYTAGHYGFTNFPDGAQLTYVPFFPGLEGTLFFDGPATQVLDKNGQLIIDTSDILTFQDGNNPVFSGKLRPDNAAYNPTGKELHFVRVNYDDSAVTNGVGVQFSLQGLMTTTFTDSKPTALLTFNRTATGKADAAGDGSLNGVPFVLTGSIDTRQKIELTY